MRLLALTVALLYFSGAALGQKPEAALLDAAIKARMPLDEMTWLYKCVLQSTGAQGKTAQEVLDLSTKLLMSANLEGLSGEQRRKFARQMCDLLDR